MSRRMRKPQQEPGQDSFLDIVANLVGILIILVMVVGVRAKDAMVAVKQTPEVDVAEVEQLADDARVAGSAATAVETDVHKVQSKIKRVDMEIAYRRRERDRTLQLLKTVELGLSEQRGELSETERERVELERELATARGRFEDLKQTKHQIENTEPPSETIEHLPTPMAKTVFGKEINLRLRGGRIAYVPMDELVAQFKGEAPQKVWKLKQTPVITEVIGPMHGFRLKYTLKTVSRSVPTRNGTVARQSVELDHYELLPVQDDLGDPLEDALRDGGQVDLILAGQRPQQTTITVWVYPNSFDDFRRLKEHLFQRGFLTAGRPLPEGVPIGGSPNGTRSAAQ